MVLHAKDWLELHELLRGAVGEPTAGALMDFLPPVGWADVATKDDLRALEASLRGEMAELRGEMAELRGEITGQLGDFKADMLRWMATTLVAGMAMSAGIAAAVSTAMGA